MRIGLFGGTFNPIHMGHLRSAEEVREYFQLQQVIFIPSAVPPHKEVKEIVSPDHRIKMADMAIEENSCFSTSDIELKRPGKSYSIETIDHFISAYGSDSALFFIIGMDAFLEINTWKDYKTLFSRCNFIVTNRSGYLKMNLKTILPKDIIDDFSYIAEDGRFVHTSGYSLYFQEIPPLDISSSLIRKRIKENRSVRYLLPEKVMDYIRLHRLYKMPVTGY